MQIISDNGLIPAIYKELKKTNNSIKKWAMDFNKHPSKEYTQIANKHMKDYITSLVTRGININQNDSENHTYYYDYNCLEKENNKCWQECAEIGTLGYC